MKTSKLAALAALAVAGLAIYEATKPSEEKKADPAPVRPEPKKPVAPRMTFHREDDWEEPVGARVGGNVSPDGTELQCDLPGGQHLKNKGGSDGAGLCVFTSIDHSARWQNVPSLVGFRDWMTKHPGGGYPSKVDGMVKRICAERGMPVPDYIQVENVDPELLKRACKSGRMPGVTYSRSPTGRYGGQKIAHMVSLVHADDKAFVVLDNNYPGAESYEWMSPEEARRAGILDWAVILLAPPPPPMPRNGA